MKKAKKPRRQQYYCQILLPMHIKATSRREAEEIVRKVKEELKSISKATPERKILRPATQVLLLERRKLRDHATEKDHGYLY